MIKNDTSFKRKIVLGVFLFAILTVAITNTVNYLFFKNDSMSAAVAHSKNKFIERENFIKYSLDPYILLLKSIQKSDIFLEYIKNKQYNKVAQIFKARTNSYKNIDQIRFIDAHGNERARVNSGNNIVSEDKLQNKYHRYYFQDSIKLKPDELYFSKMDLNVEHGVIETPHKPMLRIGLTIFHENEKKGVILLNLKIKDILAQLVETTLYNVYLIDKFGNFILHFPNKDHSEDLSFSKYLNVLHTVRNYFPKEYENLMLQEEYLGSNFYSKELYIKSEDGIKMILEVKNEFLNKTSEEVKRQLIILVIICLILCVPLAIFLVNYMIKIKKDYEDKIESYVDENNKQTQLLMQNSKLTIMGDMISMIAHQWRQPLSTQSSIISTLLLKEQLGLLDNELLKEKLHDLNKVSQKMSKIIQQFSTFFKPSDELKTINVKETLSQTLELLSEELEKSNISVEVNCEDTLEVVTYANELGQMIINIIKNSKESLEENNDESNRRISLMVYKNGNFFIIKITDNAGGIEPSLLPKIFDPYFSTKSKNSRGLGLYICKVIAEEHLFGKIEVSNVDTGAVVKITLPINLDNK
jgi:signal transduction histidine kinase